MKQFLLICLLIVGLTACSGDENPAPGPDTPPNVPAEQGETAPPGGSQITPVPGSIPDPNQTLEVTTFINNTPRFSTLAEIIRTLGFEEEFQGQANVTYFLPSNRAFETLPPGQLEALLNNPTELENLLRYHIIPQRVDAAALSTQSNFETVLGPLLVATPISGGLSVNGHIITDGDIPVINGVAHIIDGVLIPPPPNQAMSNSVMDRLQADGRFANLVNALEATGVAETLRTPGPVTFFAPVDSAFANVPPEMLASNMEAILQHHLVPSQETSNDLYANLGVELVSLNGGPILITTTTATEDGSLLIGDGATVLETDISARNGVIHVIDRVLMPFLE